MNCAGISSSEDEDTVEERPVEPVAPSTQKPLKSILKKRSDSSEDADDESEEDAHIFFSHSSNLPEHDDTVLNPGNLHKMLARYVSFFSFKCFLSLISFLSLIC